MDIYAIFVYLSIIVMPDGEIKTLSMTVDQCPTDGQVQMLHKPMMDSGEIITWAARCKRFEIPLNIPKGT